jgi:RNA polymerase sigma-70 factor (ECF subfamily)
VPAGDEAAWRELVTLHTRRVFGIAYRFVGRVDEAEDLTQDIFVKVFQSLDSLSGVGRGLRDLGRHRRAQSRRSTTTAAGARRERAASRIPPCSTCCPTPDESPLRSLERAEQARIVHRGLRALPADLREPLVLCDLKGLSYEEAAATLEIPLGTVKSRINRGRLELAKRLMGARRALEGRR